MIFIFYLGTEVKVQLLQESRVKFNVLPYLIYVTIFPIFVGCLLRLPKLMIEIRQKKNGRLIGLRLLLLVSQHFI